MGILQRMTEHRHEMVVACFDRDSGLRAFIAIHNTTLGPALGGVRMYPYRGEEEALEDVLRLSRAMTYKAACAGLPLGGGKAVIMGDPATDKSPRLWEAYARCVERLGGIYITAEDIGTTTQDMAVVARHTRWVTGLADPSPYTARGCFLGIEACVRRRLGVPGVAGLRVAIQGLGKVGAALAMILRQAGASLIVTDVREGRCRWAAETLGAVVVAPDEIYHQQAEVFAPCAMGGVLSHETAAILRTPVVAGAANNQLASPGVAEELRRRRILYAPDYVINAGGLIYCYCEMNGLLGAYLESYLASIPSSLNSVFDIADREGMPTSAAANRLAESRFLAPALTAAGQG